MSTKQIVSAAYAAAELGIKEAVIRFVTESGSFERVVTTANEGDNIWDEVVCEEIVANDDLIRAELLDADGVAIAEVYLPGGWYA